jgi:hypothetical protein
MKVTTYGPGERGRDHTALVKSRDDEKVWAIMHYPDMPHNLHLGGIHIQEFDSWFAATPKVTPATLAALYLQHAKTQGATPEALDFLKQFINISEKDYQAMATKSAPTPKAPAAKAPAAKAPAAKAPAAKAPAAKAPAAEAVGVSRYAGKKITVLKKDHGKREGSWSGFMHDAAVTSKTTDDAQAKVDASEYAGKRMDWKYLTEVSAVVSLA